MTDLIETDNILRVGSTKEVLDYLGAIIHKGQPRIYQRFGDCLKIRFTANHGMFVKDLLRDLWHFGLVPKCVVKMPDGFPIGRGRYIENAFEVIIKKIGAIEFEDDTEFERELARNKIDFKNLHASALREYPEEFKSRV